MADPETASAPGSSCSTNLSVSWGEEARQDRLGVSRQLARHVRPPASWPRLSGLCASSAPEEVGGAGGPRIRLHHPLPSLSLSRV
ncbi:UNVERIFIED_CONTAM: hypothetical protein HHA_215960 [Hammondia hammondi]|eukprot:XP_008886338.1 hypothetical protein HHA_215960 [Hammondia hammondi]